MHPRLTWIFIGLLFALFICCTIDLRSFFSVHEGMTTANATTTTYYAPNGSVARVVQNDGKTTIVITYSGQEYTYTNTDASMTTFAGPNGGTASLITTNEGTSLIVTQPDGSKVTYTTNDTTASSFSYDNYNHYTQTSQPTTYYGPNGGKATISNNTIVITNTNGATTVYTASNANTYVGPNGGKAVVVGNTIEVTGPNGTKVIYTESTNSSSIYINDTTTSEVDNPNDYNAAFYTGPNGGSATTITGPGGNTYATYDSSAYYNSLPAGISKSQIPAGQEDLYILKSEVVPPVCPKCPAPVITEKTDVTKCPPCPPCARCPEPSFECKKVPTYSAFNPASMPIPVLTDFSTFGM